MRSRGRAARPPLDWVGTCLAVLLACRAAPPEPLALAADDAAQQAEVRTLLASCGQASPAFRRLIEEIRPHPLRSVVVESGPILFGVAYGQRDVPLLTIDMSDLRRLPLSVTSWGSDSNWALTRCEALGHELSEAFHYRALWNAEDPAARAARFTTRLREAHGRALVAERAIAMDVKQMTAGGAAWPRGLGCGAGGNLYAAFGPHTEVFVMDREQRLVGFRYLRDSVVCPLGRER